jgi:polyvinyl alcohol dehydrogenase (cytochrome)
MGIRAAAATTTAAMTTVTNWPLYGHDLANTRTNRHETEIDQASVPSLTAGWSKGGLVGVTGTPVVANGVAYFGDWTGTLWAVNARTGQTVWSTKVGGGDFVGSPALGGRSVYVAIGKTLYALRRSTGKVLWQTVTNSNPYSQINASPVVVGNLVFQGTAQFEEVVGHAPFTFRGSIGAYNATTGRQVWNFFTTPNDATSGAGEGVWSTPAVDTRLGLLYVGDGQNLDNPSGPLADSILAINLKTGHLKWSHQFNHPDVFSTASYSGKDADVGASPNLWTVHGRSMVGVGSKNGTYYAFDRATGKLKWETFLTHGSTFGGVLGSSAFVDGKIIASSNIGDPASNATTNQSKVFALNPASGKVLWSKTFAGNVFAPISAVHGLAFVGTDAGVMMALNTQNGKTLWSYSAPDKVGGGPSITNGRLLWGYGFTLFKGPGKGGVISFTVSASARVHTERGSG